VESRYGTNKRVLPPDMIDYMYKRYKEYKVFSSIIAQPLEQSSIIIEAKIETLKSTAKSLLE